MQFRSRRPILFSVAAWICITRVEAAIEISKYFEWKKNVKVSGHFTTSRLKIALWTVGIMKQLTPWQETEPVKPPLSMLIWALLPYGIHYVNVINAALFAFVLVQVTTCSLLFAHLRFECKCEPLLVYVADSPYSFACPWAIEKCII